MRKSLIGLAAGLAVMFTASASQAQLNKCLDQVDGLAIKLFSTYAKALKKCKVAIQKQKDEGADANWAKAADACEKSLGSLFDINAIRGKSAIGKFYTKFDDKFFVDGGKCDSDGLENAMVGTAYISAMGHLVAPFQAPGATPWDWMKRWLALMKFKLALLEENFVFATTMNLLDDAIDNSGTDCTLPTSCNPEIDGDTCRPNLCSTTINCRSHACQLDATSSTTTSVSGGFLSVTVPISGRAVFEIRKLNPITFGILGAPNVFAIIGDSGRTIDPVGLLGNTICIDVIRSQGWCDCAGLGIPKSSNFCQDHDTLVAPGCVGVATGPNVIEDNCFCIDGGGAVTANRCGGSDQPACAPAETCGFTDTGGFCHDGTSTSAVVVLPSGPSVVGDCLNLNTIQFKTLPNAGAFGPDAVACTADDLRPPAGAASVPFTTGTASAEVKNALVGPGGCSNNANHLCREDANCATNDPNNPGTCTAPAPTISATQTVPALTGGGIGDCDNLEASQLSGLDFVGAFPALDGAGLGDVVSTFEFVCD